MSQYTFGSSMIAVLDGSLNEIVMKFAGDDGVGLGGEFEESLGGMRIGGSSPTQLKTTSIDERSQSDALLLIPVFERSFFFMVVANSIISIFLLLIL